MKLLPAIILALILNQTSAQESGRVDEINLKSAGVDLNILGDTTSKKVLVYLPPSYNDSDKSYPVVYFLTGYGSEVDLMFNKGLKINHYLDEASKSGKIEEMILVVATSKIRLNYQKMEKSPYTWGAFYEDSPVTGHWESFITKELVPFIDSNYRTIEKRESRVISGHSMGGSGALNVGLRNPELFAHIYSISSAVIGIQNLETSWMFESEKVIHKALDLIEEISTPNCGLSEYKNVLGNFIENDSLFNGNVILSFAYGSAYLGNSALQAPYFKYPFEKVNGKIVRNEETWREWQNKLTDFEPLLENYKKKNLVMENIIIEFGCNDKNKLTQGNQGLSTLLYAYGIPHEFRFYKGGHGALNERLRQFMFPYLSQHLSFN
jgi:enterochelin esterase-like enzyme